MPCLFKPATTFKGTSVSGSGPDVVARSGRFLSIAMRLKYSAAIKLLAEPCKQTNATLRESKMFYSLFLC
jgi:hypothetical protein